MKKILTAIFIIALPIIAWAQMTIPQGGTGKSTFILGTIPFGAGPLRLGTSPNLNWIDSRNNLFSTYASSTALSSGTICLTADSCRTTWPSGVPAGPDKVVQYDNAGNFGGISNGTSNLKYNLVSGSLDATDLQINAKSSGGSGRFATLETGIIANEAGVLDNNLCYIGIWDSGTLTHSYGCSTPEGNGVLNIKPATGNASIGANFPTREYNRLTVYGADTGTQGAFEVVNNASTTLFKVENNGLVGIGSTTPTTQLSVQGTSTLKFINPGQYVNMILSFEGDSISYDGQNCTPHQLACDWVSLFTGNSSSTLAFGGYVFGNGKFNTMTRKDWATPGNQCNFITYSSNSGTIAPKGPNQSGYYFLMCGTNDINNGETAASTYAVVKSLYAQARADGYKVVAFTVAPYGFGIHEDVKRAYNILLKSDPSVFDYLVDTATLLPDPTDTRYYLSDQLHPTPTGSKLMADAVTRTLDKSTLFSIAGDTTASSTVAGMDTIFGGRRFGIGTTLSPAEKLEVNGSAQFDLGAFDYIKLKNVQSPDHAAAYIQTAYGNIFQCQNAVFSSDLQFHYATTSGDGNQPAVCLQQEGGTGKFYILNAPAGTPLAIASMTYRMNVGPAGTAIGLGTADAAYALEVGGITSSQDNVRSSYFVATSSNATSTFAGGVTISGFASTTRLSVSGSATSTFTAGVNIKTGCFAINNTCVGGAGGGAGTVTSVATNNGLTGGTITTSGTLGLDISKLSSGMLTAWNGSQLYATGTPIFANFYATSTTATSTVWGGLGIATSSAPVSLTVAGSGLLIAPSGTTATALVVRNMTGTTTLQVGTLDVSGNFYSIATSTGVGYFNIDGNGKIGIGTTTPTWELSVVSNTASATSTISIGDSTHPSCLQWFSTPSKTPYKTWMNNSGTLISESGFCPKN